MSTIDRSKWVWMPHPAHLIVGNDCRFHLATYIPSPVGISPVEDIGQERVEIVSRLARGIIVSTVGEYLPDEPVREIHCNVRGIVLQGRGDARLADFMRKCGFMEIGAGRTYETMVFPAKQSEPGNEELCCPWRAVHSGGEIDFAGYNNATAAYQGHLSMCEQWATQFDGWSRLATRPNAN